VTPPEVVAIGSVVLVVGLAAFIGLSNYNAVIALQQRTDKAWANIDVALKQRHDMLPNLVTAVRGLMAFEQQVLTDVTRARAAYSPSDPIPSQAATSDQTTAAVRSLFAVVERYPDIKSQVNVMALQGAIERIEGIIADRRELYNDQVYRYNTKISTIPAIALAWLFRWLPRDFFKAGPSDTARPDVELTRT
jgi:LemA protein